MIRIVPRGLILLTIGLVAAGLAGCSDDDPVAPCESASHTVSVRVEARDECEGCDLLVVFTSDLDGTLLDYSLTSGDAEFELEVPATPGAGFYLTRVQQFTMAPMLFTEYHVVAADLAVTWELGFPMVEPEHATLQFSNIPAHDAFLVTSDGSSHSGLDLPAQLDLYLVESPNDVLVMLDLVGGPRSHVWRNGVEVGSEYGIDLDGMAPMDLHEVALSAAPDNLQFMNIGITDAGDRYRLDTGLMSAPLPPTIALAALESSFGTYRTTFQQTVSSDPLRITATETEGGLPAAVDFWAPEVRILSGTPDDCLVDVGGPVDAMYVVWSAAGSDDAAWAAEVPDPSSSMVLPLLPGFMASLYPDIVREDLELHSVDVLRRSAGTAADGSSMAVTQEYIEFLTETAPEASIGRRGPWVSPGSIVSFDQK